MSKFELPDVFYKELTPTSQKIYRSKLNHLAKGGYDTVDKLLANKRKVIEIIKEATGRDEKQRMVARQFISAISWVTDPAKLPKNNLYHKFYQTILPGKSGDDAWVKRKDYVEKSDAE
jgi:hypothetical protein